MSFTSAEYLLLLATVWLGYQLLPARYRWSLLLVASYLFYAGLQLPYLLALLALVTLVTYGCGRLLTQCRRPASATGVFWLGIGLNLALLVGLKYLPFLSANLTALLRLTSGTELTWHTPVFSAVGISYLVFQAISYLADIRLGVRPAERHLGYFALYMAFFPKLLQGPIERADDLLPQLRQPAIGLSHDNLRHGIVLLLWGMFQKSVLAQRLALWVDSVYAAPQHYQGLTLLLTSYAYAWQIYIDFAAYTSMALGSALLFNIRLTDNFNRPYLATSIADFWRRWHISFSRFILDYIFRPLQMHWRQLRNGGTALALLVTFTLSGLWHGASWNYIAWGVSHGLMLAASVFYRPWQKKLQHLLGLHNARFLPLWQRFVTFHLVSLAWILFRSDSPEQAWDMLRGIARLAQQGSAGIQPAIQQCSQLLAMAGSDKVLQPLLFSVALLLYTGIGWLRPANIPRLQPLQRWSLYLLLLGGILLLRVPANSDFIYFRF